MLVAIINKVFHLIFIDQLHAAQTLNFMLMLGELELLKHRNNSNNNK